MKKQYSFYLESELIDQLVDTYKNDTKSKIVSMALANLVNTDNPLDTQNRLVFELNNLKKELKDAQYETQFLKKTIDSLNDTVHLQTRTLIKQSERMEEINKSHKRIAQENYDSLMENFRQLARINNNFNEKELYFLNYLMLPFYKDINSYEEMPNYSLTNIYESENPLIAVNARIKNEMAKDKENRRNARKS